MIASGVALLTLGCYALYISYQMVRHNKDYWIAPTVSGFKERNKEKSPKAFTFFNGILAFVLGAFLVFLGVNCFI